MEARHCFDFSIASTICFTSLHQCAILRHATVYKVGEPSSMFIKWASHLVGIVAGVPIYAGHPKESHTMSNQHTKH